MWKQAFVVALLAAGIYISVIPQDDEQPFHFTSQLSSDGRTPFFSRFIHAHGRRVFISVDIKNPNNAYFALCVKPPGRQLPQYARKRACGGQLASQMTTGDHDTAERLVILEDRAVTLEWYSDLSSTQSGDFTIVWENHNPISAAKFEAEVHVTVYRDWISHVGGALTPVLRIARASFTALSNAYSFIRPASCRTAARSAWSVALASHCISFLGSIDGSLLTLCQALSAGHVALVFIVLVNALCYVPSLANQRWWALSSSRPQLRTLFTYQFAHADLRHIAGNMLTLLFVGTEVSESLNCDHILFLLFYLLCGLAGGLFAVWFSRAGVSTVGASGSVSGVIVALSVLRPNSAVAILGDINASNPLLLLAGTLLADLQRLGVSWQGHLGGGIAGYILALVRIWWMRAIAA